MTIPLDADFPHAYAATGAFRYGTPRTFDVTDDAVTFLRSASAYDPSLGLWRLDLATGTETPLVLPGQLAVDDSALPPAERARRERLRESGGGITAYSMSADGERITFAAGGALWLWDAAGLRSIETSGAVVDPRIDPNGERIACVVDAEVRVYRFSDGSELARIGRDGVSVGLADFIAAEELQRHRGHWWAPTGDALLVETVDESPVPVWRISDPTYPERVPAEHRYPHAGARNAVVGLLLHHLQGNRTIELEWDRSAFEYLVAVHWSADGPPLVQLADRAQTRFETFSVDPESGAMSSVDVISGTPWLDVVAGTPAWATGGRLISFVDDRTTDCRRLTIDGTPVTPPGFNVAGLVSAGAYPTVHGSEDPRTSTAVRVEPDGSLTRLADGFAWHAFAGNGTVFVRVQHEPHGTSIRFDVMRGNAVVGGVLNNATRASVVEPEYVELGERELNAVVLWPQQALPGRLPVVMSPYGGPHHARVLAAAGLFSVEQWLANQGFAVVVADGRGTPGRGLAWDHAIAHDFAGITLTDQVDALDAALAMFPDRLDGDRVGIRGWSYGGYLSALALLARPDRFHVGIAGAPVTQWRLYDTAYTERYLGHPDAYPEVYEANSLVGMASRLRGRLMIVHGLADDNVVAAHSLQLSAALMAAGKLHDFLPLAGVSHMTPQVTVKENLLRMEAAYLAEHLSR